MGGKYSPTIFQLQNICKKCNNDLGLWVDACYAKSWFITNQLADAARLLCTKPNDPWLPLVCTGLAKIPNINLLYGYAAENWIGPFGETVIWIRPQDERMDSYIGVNPTETKKKSSVAYFFPVSDNLDKHMLALRSFHRTLGKRSVRKIFCAEMRDRDGALIDPKIFWFDSPTPDEKSNQDAIRTAIRAGNISAQLPINLKFDRRFMCKLALAIGYSLFGEAFLGHATATELRKGIWPPIDGTKSKIRGTSAMFAGDTTTKIMGYPGAVAIIVTNTGTSWSLYVSINEKFPLIIELGPGSMTSKSVNAEEGYALLLFPYRARCIELTMVQLIAHRSGVIRHASLKQIDTILEAAAQFNAMLLTCCR